MAENKIIPWAQTGTANVLSDDAYASDVAKGGLYVDGVKTGQASSQQANKTWRQATAPGSGLGQFLVDNLSVDVTDADTPSTFSTRIANAVLKLAQISPFNQSWATATGGYRKYAIVSDSSGNFWVSTADQNVTVPGTSSAKWQGLLDGYATEAWANEQFLQLADSTKQTVTGTVEFGGATTVPDITDFTGQSVLNAKTAEDRYKNKSTAVSTSTTTSGAGNRRADGIFIITQPSGQHPYIAGYQEDGTYVPFYVPTVSMLPTAGTITGGTYTKTPLNDGTGRSVLVQNIYFGLLANNPNITFPFSYSEVPDISFACSTENVTQNTAFVNIAIDSHNEPMISTSGATLHISRGAPDVEVSGNGVHVWATVTGIVS